MIDENLRNGFSESDEVYSTIFDGPSFDNSIIGYTLDGKVVYEFNSMIHELAIDEGWSDEEAQEFIENNTLKILPHIEEETRPIIMYFREDI